MTNPNFERIKILLDTSGLLSKNTIPQKTSINYDFSGETLLITGAAGSIGSGLCNLLFTSNFKRLILVDNAETSLFYLKHSIDFKEKDNIEFILGDIRDKPQMSHIFETFKPTYIFHTAAYKHVSIVEENPFAAIKTNILATKLLSKLAIEHYSKRFIFISTDKAVNPVGVMGMTKLISENYLSKLNSNITQFISARFGNIFGSNGSVVPLFISQLKNGKNITITNKNVSRLFIDKTKACSLILELVKLDMLNYAKVSFEMGAPIRIMDLAKVLISEFDTIKNTSAKINISELSEGEKLHESIISKNEQLISTSNKNIYYIAENHHKIDLQELETINHNMANSDIKHILKKLCKT